MTEELTGVLKKLGISAGWMLAILVVAVAFYVYGQYLSTKLNKLQIEQLQIELGKPVERVKK